MTFTYYSIRINGIEVATVTTLAEAREMTAEVGEYVLCFDEQPHRMYLDKSAQMWFELDRINHASKVYEKRYGVAF